MTIEPQPPPLPVILVLEDEMMVAMLLEDMLGDLGCGVAGPASTVQAALALLDGRRIDAALLDVNLSYGQSGYPVAEALRARDIPFAFVTGYGAGTLNPEFRNQPTLQKPFYLSALARVLADLGVTRSRGPLLSGGGRGRKLEDESLRGK